MPHIKNNKQIYNAQHNLTQQHSIRQQKMDQRLYHYEYRRPRPNNPTYSSFNVNSSMTFFMNGPNNPNPNSSPNPNSMSNGQNYQRKSSYEDAYSNVHNTSQYGYGSGYGGNLRESIRETPPQVETPRQRDRAQSQLSSYGNNSLAFNEREIYNKQNSKFNIISLKPKEVPDQIKQYPKLTLQDKDDYYYKKVQKMRDYELSSSAVRNSQQLPQPGHHYQNEGPVVAGKHTFAPEEGKNPNYYQHGRYFTPKMLNHADQVSHIM